MEVSILHGTLSLKTTAKAGLYKSVRSSPFCPSELGLTVLTNLQTWVQHTTWGMHITKTAEVSSSCQGSWKPHSTLSSPGSTSIPKWFASKGLDSSGKKPPSCHLHYVNFDRETNAIAQSTTNSEKNCWWEKIPGYMWRIQCAFVKKNLLTCSLKLLIKDLREATEWWTKEPPSSLFNTFKSTGNNSDKIYELLDSVLLPCLQFLKKPLENKEHLANLS